MRAVEMPMRMSVHISTGLRPYLSPRWPARNAPRGRNKKLTPTVAKATRALSAPSGAKNS